jgi:secondary thiamine-phosphate synthase enzyme
MVQSSTIRLKTGGHCDVIDITRQVAEQIDASGVQNGAVTIFAVGSTAAIGTIESESGLVADFKLAWERLIPKGISYRHDQAWGDGNGHSHLRASILGPSLTVPVIHRRMTLGTWQQVVYVDFDNRPRSREIVVQILGE